MTDKETNTVIVNGMTESLVKIQTIWRDSIILTGLSPEALRKTDEIMEVANTLEHKICELRKLL